MIDNKINSNMNKNYAVSFDESLATGSVSNVKTPVNNTSSSSNSVDNSAIERAVNRSFANIKTDVNAAMYASGRHNAVVEEVCLTADYDESSNVSTTITTEDYKEMLKASGFCDNDINRLLNGEITAQELINEIMNDFDNPERMKDLLSVSYLQSLGLDYTNMDELLASVSEAQAELEQLKLERTALQEKKQELEDMLYLIKCLQAGMPLSLNTSMWKVTDQYGNIQYVELDSIRETGQKAGNLYEIVTYESLYKDSELFKQLKEIAKEENSFLGIDWTSYKWTGSEEQEAFLQKLIDESEKIKKEV